MRYRPFGKSGVAISALTLRLGDAARNAGDLVLAALDSGINSFQIDSVSEALRSSVKDAFAPVERGRLFVTLRVRGERQRTLAESFEDLGLDRADLVLINDPRGPAPPPDLEGELRETSNAPGLGVATRGDIDQELLDNELLVAIASPFNLTSGLPDRQRIREAEHRGLAVFGEDFWPQALRDGVQDLPRPSLWRRRTDPLAGIGGYDFLHDTPDWSAEEICLAHALTEPFLTSVCVTAPRPADIQRLAAAVGRELPDNVRAQIDLARFSAQERQKAAGLA